MKFLPAIFAILLDPDERQPMTARLAVDLHLRRATGFELAATFDMPLDEAGTTVLFGASGCGKTTVLRCLAGLETPDAGRIVCGDAVWFDSASRRNLPPQERQVGLTDAGGLLFPHLSVRDNLLFGPRLGRGAGPDLAARFERWVGAFELGGLLDRKPAGLSAGERQRVALARTLLSSPRVLLLDEPFANLDAPTRLRCRDAWREHRVAARLPTLLVTHDRDELLALADRLVILDGGRVVQSGRVEAVFERPADPATAGLLGIDNLLAGDVLDVTDGLARIRVGRGELLAPAPPGSPSRVWVCLRGEDVHLQLGAPPPTSARNQVSCTIAALEPAGPLVRVRLVGPFALTASITRAAAVALELAPGGPVQALIKAVALHLIPRGPEPPA